MSDKEFDVLILGAGPAGAACAMVLAQTGLSVAILDKAAFPRDKTCGDALSIDVINQLSTLSPVLAASFAEFTQKTSANGIRVFSPDRSYIDISIDIEGKCGHICKRLDFDNLLVQHLKQLSNIHLFENCAVKKIDQQPYFVALETEQGIFKGQILVGADGAYSVASKHLGTIKTQRKHYSAGLRVYYEGVSFFNTTHFIELHFLQELLPGYLWIFPLPDNKANVGLGMLSSIVSKKKINLKETLQRLLSTDPSLKERFKNARPLENVKGYGLPLGSKKRVISGARILLTGDAASLIDPLTGEGIGNAIRSGRIAGDHIKNCFSKCDFSAAFNNAYDQEIYRRMGGELRLSTRLQHLCKHPKLMNFVVKKANQRAEIKQLLVEGLTKTDKKVSLISPGFYYRLLFK